MNRKLGFKTIRYESVTSTNEVLRKLAEEGLEPGTVVTAKVQTQGKGRMTRKWESPEGGLWMSVLLETENGFDNEKFGLLPLMAGSSVATAIIMEYDLEAGVKWPNDVLVNGKKVCGILGELLTVNEKQLAIIGIGINVNNPVQKGYDFSSVSTSVVEEFGKKVKLEVLENTILEELNFRAELLETKDYDKILEDWRNLSETLGKKVTIHAPKEKITGIAKDIDENGSLLVDTDGRIVKVIVGDCEHLE
ncbi:MAG: biotin--[acetyl-CoA-carboxylase] ligase [Thermoplasmata archaeon]|nr:biotin--[acetyl-CoA-carboxylase] ligase [Thermoplasmata archaeon]